MLICFCSQVKVTLAVRSTNPLARRLPSMPQNPRLPPSGRVSRRRPRQRSNDLLSLMAVAYDVCANNMVHTKGRTILERSMTTSCDNHTNGAPAWLLSEGKESAVFKLGRGQCEESKSDGIPCGNRPYLLLHVQGSVFECLYGCNIKKPS